MLKVEENNHHEQVWLCQACERAPAEFLCKADSASLCASCDSDIHSANPLARRHHRVPISSMLCGPLDHGLIMTEPEDMDGEDEAASWLLLNPVKNGGLFGGEVDEYLDLDDYNSSQSSQFNDHCNYQQQDYGVGVLRRSHGSDSIVPIQYGKGKENRVQEVFYQLGLDYESSNTGYNYPSSMSHSVSVSSMDVGVVPESTSEASISISGIAVKTPAQLTPVDREARVLRYREKKKNRKFEKTIRYASRKAYAEVRPRIKGRFAKRATDAEVEVDQMLSTYGIVPSFL